MDRNRWPATPCPTVACTRRDRGAEQKGPKWTCWLSKGRKHSGKRGDNCLLLVTVVEWLSLVFGPRQDPNGAYAAVVPKWIASLIKGESVFINGDGETSRDFCLIANVVQANLLAATSENADAVTQVYDVAVGDPPPSTSSLPRSNPTCYRDTPTCNKPSRNTETFLSVMCVTA